MSRFYSISVILVLIGMLPQPQYGEIVEATGTSVDISKISPATTVDQNTNSEKLTEDTVTSQRSIELSESARAKGAIRRTTPRVTLKKNHSRRTNSTSSGVKNKHQNTTTTQIIRATTSSFSGSTVKPISINKKNRTAITAASIKTFEQTTTEQIVADKVKGSIKKDERVTTETNAREDIDPVENREKPLVKPEPIKKISGSISLPSGATSTLIKPTKYHHYPHNQHIYLLPECAVQQVCNAVYVRLNVTQPLCACPSRYRDPCSASLNADDLHTTRLMSNPSKKKAVTLIKTCEATSEVRECRTPRDWSLLALQNVRTGKSHYLVICRCPEENKLEGPKSHDQPTYASVPGIRVYGMMCIKAPQVRRPAPPASYLGTSGGFGGHSSIGTGYKGLSRTSRPLRIRRDISNPPFPWDKIEELKDSIMWHEQQ